MRVKRSMAKLVILPIAALIAVYIAGCGGGGGGTSTTEAPFPSRPTTANVTGTIEPLTVDSGYVARVQGQSVGAERAASAVAISDFTGFTVEVGSVTGAISGNTYTAQGVTPGRNVLVKIYKDKIMLKAYIPNAEAGETASRNVGVVSTAAAIVWEEMGKPESTSVENLESQHTGNPDTSAIRDVVDALNTAIADPAAADALEEGETLLDVPEVRTHIADAVDAADTVAPTIVSVSPNDSVEAWDPVNQYVAIVFNEKMKTSETPDGITVEIKDVTNDTATDTVEAPVVEWRGSTGKLLVVKHGVILSNSANYIIIVSLTPSAIKDAAGNELEMPSEILDATVEDDTITIDFDTTFAAPSWVEEEPTEHTADETGPDDRDFVMAFYGGTTIAGSGAAYVGAAQCASCHSSVSALFAETNHSTAFERKKATMTKNCVACHAIDGARIPVWAEGAATPTRSYDYGAFGLAATNYSTITSLDDVPEAMRSIQCENCHGPASLHIDGDGDKNFIVSGLQASAVSTCDVCHDAPTHHLYSQMWRKSGHAITLGYEDASHMAGKSCNPCHSSEGFLQFTERLAADPAVFTYDGLGTIAAAKRNVNCATCHDPHVLTEEGEPQLRLPKEELCEACHSGRKGSPGVASTRTPPYGNPHHNVQTRVLHGESGMTKDDYMYMENPNDPIIATAYVGRTISAYGGSMGDDITCVDCHMYDEGHGPTHTFKPNAEACKTCHTGMDGAASIGYKQAQYLNRYTPVAARELLAKADFATFTDEQKKLYALARWNLALVDYDGSKGVHNTPYVNKLIDDASELLTELGY